MKYNFDEAIDRCNTSSLKWDFCEKYLDADDVLPMWVADMDFQAPQPVIEAVKKRAEHGIYGYAEESRSFYEAAAGWLKRRHNWPVRTEWLQFCPGIVPAIHLLVQTFTRPGDQVIVQTPVYYPFFGAIKTAGCQILKNPLKLENGCYSMDFDDLEKKAPQARMLILCSPHNPGGILWSREDLTRLGEICLKNNLLVISDEIHADLVLYQQKHFPFASLSEDLAMNSITTVAPSKTFNLAGLQASYVITPNPDLATDYRTALEKAAIARPNLFAIAASEAAYNYGDEWLDQLLAYLEASHRFVENFIEKEIPKLEVIKAQASYLAWIDCRQLGLTPEELKSFMLNKAGLGLNQGYIFGEGGEGFVRMNLGCPRALITRALEKLRDAVNSI